MLSSKLRQRLRIHPEASLLDRARVVALLLAVVSALSMVPPLLQTGDGIPVIVGCVAVLFGLCGWWTWGYRRGEFPLLGEPVEVLGVLVVMHETPGNPLLPLLGLLFRSLYGSSRLAWVRYVTWMAALLLAHAYRGSVQLQGDLARVAGVALVPVMANFLRSSVARLEASERRLRSLVQNSTDVLTVLGSDQSIRWQANSVLNVLGWHPDDLVGRSFEEVVHETDRPAIDSYMAACDGTRGLTRILAIRLRHRDGRFLDFEVVISDRRHDTAVAGFVLNMRDATERLRLERELRAFASQREHDALHDPLTGLHNRRSLFAAIEEAIVAVTATRPRLALLLIDLDHFKELNDTLGHHVGDQILRQVASKMLGVVGDGGFLTRLGGDEFAVLVDPGDHAIQSACALAERIREGVSRPFQYEGMTLMLEASVGIALFPDHATDADKLLQHADIAMYEAKRQRSGHELYRPDTNGHTRDTLALLGELPGAIDGGQLIIHYQPKFALSTGKITGVEALVRWQHPHRGLLMPDAFLPLIERTGLMRSLTQRVIADAIRQAAYWTRQGLRIPVAVNLSAPDLIDAHLAGTVERALADNHVDSELLEVEVTERIITSDPDRVISTLTSLRTQGVTIALDDFGTGSSSLSYLRQLPVQVLKIDRSFVHAASTGEPADVALLANIIDLAGALGLRSIAEGIETEAERQLLSALGCDEGQGFGLARPTAAEHVSESLNLGNAEAATTLRPDLADETVTASGSQGTC